MQTPVQLVNRQHMKIGHQAFC